jgi:hypothetical protein
VVNSSNKVIISGRQVIRLHEPPGLPRRLSTKRPIVESALPLSEHLNSGFSNGLHDRQKIDEAIRNFRSLVEATKTGNFKTYQKFSKSVVI